MYPSSDFAVLIVLSPDLVGTTVRVWSYEVLAFTSRLIPSLRPGTTVLIHDETMADDYWRHQVQP
jgi:hypothetical protein